MIEIIGPLVHATAGTTATPAADASAAKPAPLQKQLIERLQQAILTGRLPAGSLLPSSRLLATEMGVSRNTVVIAYEHLAAVGYVFADRKGTRVSTLSSPAARGTPRAPSAAPEIAYASRVSQFEATRTHTENLYALTPGTPALDRFPLAAWRRALERAMERALPLALGYGTPAGEPALRDAIAAHLRVARGVRCDGAQIVITEGAQEALNLCVHLLSNPGDVAWAEDPGYRGAKAAFNLGDLSTVPIPVDSEGMDVPAAAWRAHPPKLIYTSPAHQYPTGAVLSVARRLELIAQARRCGAWIIEDDYDGEFRHTGEPIASMQGLVDDAPVLYVGSFSKTMFPALRIGFVVLPRAIAEQAAVALQEMLRGGHRLEQLALAHFIEGGEFGRHLGRMRRLYRERQQALRDALAEHFVSLFTARFASHVTSHAGLHAAPPQILGGDCGMHLTLRLPAWLCDRTLVERAHAEGLNPRALSGFALRASGETNGIVIGYGNTPAEQLAPAIRVLAALAREIEGEAVAGEPREASRSVGKSAAGGALKSRVKAGAEAKPKARTATTQRP
ncbi:MocR-like pyridoxine biosynthesis transcription factor PdxR [Paraburkholderia susongensis]|uniref:GntR family transcriptional regulator / MocR family aminotransferase n=1 Tax=Paraburkholderia susongensis TaxID=1515439 RepID=A0A1X7LM85_9BURK|nr:PLP-dependent aminotransferase family protein [Paraburkholderia susongensis]SMG54981.1 GntR family transcriptional regulator / MocR family aminotransferase [Paraburkholderia susongensis]